MKRKYFGGWKQHLCPQIRLFCHWKTTLFFPIFNPSIVVDEVRYCMKKKQITCLSFCLLSYRWGGGPWQGKTDDVSSNHNQYSIQAHQTHRWKYIQDFFVTLAFGLCYTWTLLTYLYLAVIHMLLKFILIIQEEFPNPSVTLAWLRILWRRGAL